MWWFCDWQFFFFICGRVWQDWWVIYLCLVLLYPWWILNAKVPETGCRPRFFLAGEILKILIVLITGVVWNTLSCEFFAWQEIRILLLRRHTSLVDILFDDIFSAIPLSTPNLHYRIVDLPLLHYNLFSLDLLFHDLHLHLAFLHEVLDLLYLILEVLLFIQLQLEVFMLFHFLL